ncbi:hypothetical protein NDU88_003902 [Pleurodeles waltl]|uniref:Uncharacterized protein n=1 Tax=Pleurodeles waltl TaxID=8319 RepID=A0AAV7LI93_PLEWA|nr:hypothetical protein NDU88_003902 [Pleurodeles waltl]
MGAATGDHRYLRRSRNARRRQRAGEPPSVLYSPAWEYQHLYREKSFFKTRNPANCRSAGRVIWYGCSVTPLSGRRLPGCHHSSSLSQRQFRSVPSVRVTQLQ